MKNILIVEDDTLVASDIAATLERLGHGVSAVASSGEEALRSAADHLPDLVLMDIKLKGKMDGVETAHRLRDRFKTPIIYLTAHADDKTLKRTKYTEPYGYIVKPFREDTLRTTIEMAAYKNLMDREVRESESRFRQMSSFIPMMSWTAQADGLCTYVNFAWLEFTGTSLEESRGKGWEKCVHRGDLGPFLQAYNAAFDARQPFRFEFRLRRHDGSFRWVEGSGAPMYTVKAAFEGYVGICMDIHDRKMSQQKLEELLAEQAREAASAREKLQRAEKPSPGGVSMGDGGGDPNGTILEMLRIAEDLKERFQDDKAAEGRLDEIIKTGHRALAITK